MLKLFHTIYLYKTNIKTVLYTTINLSKYLIISMKKLLFLFLLCSVIINAQAQGASIISTNRPTYKIGDTIQLRGNGIKTLKLKSFASRDSFVVNTFISKLLSNTDTLYNFIVPNTVKNDVYLINAFSYTNQLSDSIRLVRFFVIPRDIDSLGVIVSGANEHIGTIPLGLNNVMQVAGGGYNSLALKGDGTVVAWGAINNVPIGLNNVVQIASGGNSWFNGSNRHNIALKADGTVVAWGDNGSGQTSIPIGLNNVVQVAAGVYHSLTLKGDGTVVAWGDNSSGQTNIPAGLSNVIQVAGGQYHSIALKGDGTVVAWGDNSSGQSVIPAGLNNVIQVAAGYSHNLALKADGTVVAWGSQSSQAGLNNVVQIAGGGGYCIALKSDGTVYSWGYNSYRQTSNLTILKNVLQIAAGGYHSLAIYKLQLKTESNSGGTLSPTIFIKNGDTKRVTYQANGGYFIDSVFINGVLNKDSITGFTFNNISQFYIISVDHDIYNYNNIIQYPTVRVVFNAYSAPSKPRNVIGIGGNKKAILNFLPPTNFGSRSIVKYIAKVLGTNIKDSSTTTAITLTGLTIGQAYNITVQAVNNEGLISDIALVPNIVPINGTEIISTNKPTYKIGDTIQLRGNGIKTLKLKSFASRDSFVVNTFISKLLSNTDTLYNFIVPNTVKNDIYLINAFSYTNQLSDSIRLVRFFVIPRDIDSLGVIGWGDNSNQQKSIPAGLNNVVQIAGGEYFSLALKGDGTVVAWGNNYSGKTNIPAGLNNVVQIAGGYSHSLALKADGTVVAWGYNGNGVTSIPTGLNNVVQIAGGSSHSLALKADGTVVAWGWNGNGQTSIPAGLNNVMQIAGGGLHSLALKKDGTVVAWGNNNYGQTSIPAGLNNVVQIAGEYSHSLALKADGTVVAWGWNGNGQTSIPAGLNNVVQIAAGRYHSLALKVDGTVVAWGDNTYGQTNIPAGLNNVAQIASGSYFNLAISKLNINTTTNTGGTITPTTTFLKNGDKLRITYQPNPGYFIDSIIINGVLNTDSITGYTFNNINQYQTVRVVFTPFSAPSKPRNVIATAGNKKAILNFSPPTNFGSISIVKYIAKILGTNIKDSSINTSITLTALTIGQTYNITVQAVNNEGLISDTALVPNIVPITVTEIISTNKPTYKIGDTIQLRGNGIKTLKLKSFANRDSFVITNFITKTPINSDTNYTFIVPNTVKNDVYLINAFSYTNQLSDSIRLVRFFVIPRNIDSLGVIGWGNNNGGQTIIPAGLNNVVQVAGGGAHSLALKADGTVVAWGRDWNGQINIPTGLKNVVQVAGGASYSLVLKADGTVVAWGFNGYGQTSIPADLNNVVQISAGSTHALALKTNGRLVAWGNNNWGQTTIQDGLDNVVKVVAGENHSLALKGDGSVIDFGYYPGMYGFYDKAYVPAGLSNVVQIESGDNHSLALKLDSTLVAWGYNSDGQTSIPAGLNNVVQVAGGRAHSLALNADGNVVAWGDNTYGQTNIPAGLNNVAQIASGGHFNLAIVKLLRINTSAGYGGNITPTSFGLKNTNYTINFTPNTGFAIDSIIVNDTLKYTYPNSPNSYNFNNISSYQKIRVTFKFTGAVIAKSYTAGGYVQNNYGYNNNLPISKDTFNTSNWLTIYSFYPNKGYVVDSVFVNGSLQAYPYNGYTYMSNTTLGYNFYNISNGTNYSIRVTFKYVGFSTIAKSFGIGGSPTNNFNINNNVNNSLDSFTSTNNVTYNFNPKLGYKVDSVLVNNTLISTYPNSSNNYSFGNLIQNGSIRVTFKYVGVVVIQRYFDYSKGYLDLNSGPSSTNYNTQTDTFTRYSDINYSFYTNWWGNNNYYIDSVIAGNQLIGTITTPIYSYTFNNLDTNSFIKITIKTPPAKVALAKSFGNNGYISNTYNNNSTNNSIDSINFDASFTINFYPNNGYVVDSFLIDNVLINPINYEYNNSYTFNNFRSNKTIRVTFKLQPTKVYIYKSFGANGYVTINNNSANNTIDSINYNSGLTANFYPNNKYVTDSVLINGQIISVYPNSSTYYPFNYSGIKSNRTIRVTFKFAPVYVTKTVGANGSVTNNINNNQNNNTKDSIGYNSSITYTINANTGYLVDSVFVNNVLQPNLSGLASASYTFNNVTNNNNTIRVVFYKGVIINTSVIGGTISPSSQTLFIGSNYRVTYSSYYGYIIDSILINNRYVGKDFVNGYTFQNINADSTIKVIFKPGNNNYGGCNTFVYTDSFNNNILDTLFWKNRATNKNDIRVESNILKIEQNTTDLPTNLYTNWLYVNQNANITVERKVYLNYNNTYFTPSISFEYNNSDTAIFRIGYNYTNYYTSWDDNSYNINIQDALKNYNNDGGGYISDIKLNDFIRGSWFTEKLIYSTQTNVYKYYINGVLKGYGQLSKPAQNIQSIRLRFSPYGWYTGNYQNMDDFKISMDTCAVLTPSPKYKITTEVVNGVITPSTFIYDSITNFTVQFKPKNNDNTYLIDSFIINGISQNPANFSKYGKYNLSNINSNNTIRVVYNIPKYTITKSTNGLGKLVPNINSIDSIRDTVVYGTYLYYNLIPKPGYAVDSIIVNGNLVSSLPGSNNIYNFNNVYSNQSIRVSFRKSPQYIITKNIGNAAVSNDTVLHLSSVIIPLNPSLNNYVDSVFVDGLYYGTNCNNCNLPDNTQIYVQNTNDSIYQVQLQNIRGSHNIRVVYSNKLYNITSINGANGSTSLSGIKRILGTGKNYRLYFYPNGGYITDSIFVNDNLISTSPNSDNYINLNNISENKRVRVTFKTRPDKLYLYGIAGVGGYLSNNQQYKIDSVSSGNNYYLGNYYYFYANSGYRIDSVIVNGVLISTFPNSNNYYYFDYLNRNTTIKITFIASQNFIVTASAGINGSISPNGNTLISNANYNYTYFNFYPNIGYSIDSVIVDNQLISVFPNSSTSYSIFNYNLNKNKTIRVTFKALNPFNLQVDLGGYGYVGSWPNGSVNIYNVDYTIYNNQSNYFDFIANSGYSIDSVFIDSVFYNKFDLGTRNFSNSFSNPYKNRAIKITFKALQKYSINVNLGYGGFSDQYTDRGDLNTVGVNYNGIRQDSVYYNTSIYYNFYANSGYSIDSVFVDSVFITKNNFITTYYSITLNNVVSNRSIRLTYIKIPQFQMQSSAGINGSMYSSINNSNYNNLRNDSVVINTNVTYYFSRNSGYYFDSLFVNGNLISTFPNTSSSYTFNSINRNNTIRITFRLAPFQKLIVESGSGGTTNTLGTSFINYGSSNCINITANYGYLIDTIWLNGNANVNYSGLVNLNYCIGYLLSDTIQRFKVRFKPIANTPTYSIFASAGANGSITNAGRTVTYRNNFNTTYNFYANNGYWVDSVIVNDSLISSGSTNVGSSYYFGTINTNQSIRVTFRPILVTSSTNFNCNGLVNIDSLNPTGVITSNSNDIRYNNNQNCQWLIKAPKDAIIKLRFTKFKTEQNFDFVKVYDGINSAATQLFNASGNLSNNLPTIVSTGINIFITFTSDGYVVDSGFSLVYSYILPVKRTINVSSSANGTVYPNGQVSVNEGGSTPFLLTGNIGYGVDSIKINDSLVSTYPISPSSLTLLNIDQKLYVSFKAVPTFTINTSSDSNGTITPSLIANIGSSTVINFTPKNGYSVDTVKLDGRLISTYPNSYSSLQINNINSNRNIYVSFKRVQTIRYRITTNSDKNGSITPSIDTVIGSSVTINFTPKNGYRVDTILLDGKLVSTYPNSASNLDLNNIRGNSQVYVSYKLQVFSITTRINDTTNGSIDSSVVVNLGNSVTINFIPKANYIVDSIFVNNVYIGKTGFNYTFNNIKSNQSIYVKFKQVQYVNLTINTNYRSSNITNTQVVKILVGSNYTYSLIPIVGYGLDSAIFSNGLLYTLNNVTFNLANVVQDATVSIYYKPIPIVPQNTNYIPNPAYFINTLTTDGNAYIATNFNSILSKNPITTIKDTVNNLGNSNLTKTIYVKPKEGYQLDSIFIDNSYYTGTINKNIGFISPDSNGKRIYDLYFSFALPQYYTNHTVYVKMKPATSFNFIATAGIGGRISPSGNVSLYGGNGLSQLFYFYPDTGYQVDIVYYTDNFTNFAGTITNDNYYISSFNSSGSISVTFKPVKQYTITAIAGPNGTIKPSGTKLLNGGNGNYQYYLIKANPGYEIDSIVLNDVLQNSTFTNYNSSYTYNFSNVTSNQKIYVSFKRAYLISTLASYGGSITASQYIKQGNNFTVNFTPLSSYFVDSVFVDDTLISNGINSARYYSFINVQRDRKIRVSFTKIINLLHFIDIYKVKSIYKNGTGISTKLLDSGSTYRFTYQPNKGLKLDSIIVNGNYKGKDSTRGYTFRNITGDSSLTVIYRGNRIIPSVKNGIIADNIEVIDSTNYRVTYSPLVGFVIDSIYINGIYYGKDSTNGYTFKNITGDSTIRILYKPIIFTITSSAGNGGSISPQGTNILNYGARPTFTFTPNNGYIIDSIIVNGFKINNVSSYTFESVKSNQTIRIVYKNLKTFKFKLNFYLNNYFQNNIYLDSNSNYRISYSIPNGYYIDSFYTNLGENLNKDSVFAYTFTNINANRDIFLILKQKQINVQIIGVNGNQFSININDRTLAKKDSTKLSYFYGNKLNAYLQTDSNFYIDSIWIDNSVLYSYKKQASSNETNPINFYNLNINNLFNNTIVKIKLGQFTPPTPPRLDTVIVANAQAYLYFTPPTNNGGVSILKYEVSSINQNIKLYATQSPVRITGLQNDSNYQFVIKAINKVGTSIASNVSNVIIPKNNVYVVTTNVTNGLISGGASITNNGTYRVTYQANSGFQLDKVYVNDTLRNDSTQGYTFKNFNRNQYIYVVFKPIIYKLLAQSNNGGMFILNRESKQQINISTNAGSNNAIIIQANYGYKIDSIFVNNVLKPFTNKQLTQINILNILGDSTIRVVFKKASYVVKINYGKGGQVYPSNQINVLENDSINIRLFPNYGYEVDSIFINNQYINTSVKTNYWFKNVQGDSTIRVVFKNVLYSITSSVKNTNGGIISPAGKQFAQKGENKTYYIIPYYGYKIDTIWVNEIAVIINPNATSYFAYTFKNIQGDSSIKVSYKKNRSTIVSAVNRINNIRYGRITPSGKVTLINGQGYKYKIIPNSNGKLDSILIDNKKVLLTLNADSSGYDTATQIYTFKNIQSDKSINVFFSSKPAVNNYKINANEYTIISSSNLENALNVEGENIFSAGDNFTYTFEYDTLYYLDSLIIDGVVTNNYLNINNSISYAFTNINANHSIRAVFKKNIFTIISEQDGNGNINYVGTNYVKLGAQIKYSYQAESNYFVDSVIVNGVLIDSPQSFTFTNVQQDNTIKIIYNQSQYTIQSSVTEGGNINPLGTLLLNKGETYTYQYSANAGYSIDSVIIDGIVNYDSLSSYTFTNVQTNHRIQIVYKKNYYTITSSKNIEGGLISNEGINIVVNGSTQLYFIQANAGYKIDSIYINNIGQSINQQTYIYEINNINKDINIYVIFKNIYYTITASAEVGGGISPIGNIQVKYDSSQAFSITPNTGYVIDSVIVNGVNVGKINSYTFNNVKGDSNIRVTFKLKTFSITATAGTGGSISPQATTTLNYGTSQRYIITANTGYVIDSVIVNGFKVDSTTSYTFNNITANQTIQAVFKIAVVCPQTKLSPNIVRVGDALKSDITTFAKQRWYLAGTIKDSTTNNTYTPTDAGVYTLLGIDALGCESNLSKKYYYSKTCITPAGRLGNGANIQANIVGNANLIIIKWCTEIIQENITIKILSIDGVSIYEQKVPANLGVYIINKQQINNKNYVIEVIDNKGEVLQISDVVN